MHGTCAGSSISRSLGNRSSALRLSKNGTHSWLALHFVP